MRKKILYLLVLLLGLGFVYASGKLLSVKKTFGEGEEVIKLEGDTNFSLPDFYPSPKDSSLVVLEFKGVDGSAILGEHKYDKGAVERISATQDKDKLRIDVKFRTLNPFSIYAEDKGILIKVDISKTNRNVSSKGSKFKGINLKKNKGKLSAEIEFSGAAPFYRSFILKRNLSHNKPIRLVVDLIGVKIPRTNRKVESSGVLGVRTAQFSQEVARVVFDMERIPKYSIEKAGTNISVKFGEKAHRAPRVETSPVVPVKPKTVKKEVPEKIQKVQEKAPPKNEEKPPIKKTKLTTFNTVTIGGGTRKYYGEKYTFRFKDADIRDVIRFIARLANLNVIFDPGVSGKVTCELVNIPWDQALDLILRTNKLGYVIEGNVLRVAPLNVLSQEEALRRKMRESALPLKTVTRALSYAEAKNVKSIAQKYLSPRGQIVVDSRTNTIIIKDIADNIDLIDRLIDTLDAPIPQVSIEARIVETNTNYTRNLGIQWGFMGYANPYYGNQTNLVFPNKVLVNGTPIEGTNTGGLTNPLNGYAINLPSPAFNSAIGISLGNVTDSFGLDIGLTAMEQEGYGKILSAPKIATQDNHPASILQGRQIPVQTVVNNTIMVRYVNAALELHVTPHITAEGTIIMKIEIKNNSADFTHLVMGIPPIITQSATTVMMVKDGNTAAIGGMYRVEDSTTVNKTPFLSSIPFIGNVLFRGSSINRLNRELLIFLTPRIIKR